MSLTDIQKPAARDEELFLLAMADTLKRYHERLDQLEGKYNYIGCSLIIPCYFNFRDALFHYEKAYNSREVIALHSEQNAMHEHLHRAVKDGCIGFLQIVNRKLTILYQYQCDSRRLEKLTEHVRAIAAKAGVDMDFIHKEGEDVLKLENLLHDKVTKEEYIFIYEYVFNARFDVDKVGLKKQLQTIFHTLRNLELDYRSRAMHIVKSFSIEPDKATGKAPVDDFWMQCDEQITAIENSQFCDFFLTADFLNEPALLL